MECVIDTSAISWLGKIGRLELLTDIYHKIFAPPAVLKELKAHYATSRFVQQHIIPITFRSEKEKKRFERLVRRWRKKVSVDDIADIEVFIGHRYFTETNEALYANKDAEERFSPYGHVRDIAGLYELAEQGNIFARENSIAYLECLLNAEPPYRTKYIRELIKKLGRI